MKKLIYWCFVNIVLLLPAVMPAGRASAQSTNQNYVVTWTPRIAGIKDGPALKAALADKNKVQTAIEYADGLGRPLQGIRKEASPLGYDVVQHHSYDIYGREYLQYLPYVPTTGTKGNYRGSTVAAINTFYATPPDGVVQLIAGNYTYNYTKLESSSLSRPLEQGFPGSSWKIGSGHTVRSLYEINTATDAVRQWEVSATGGASYIKSYDANTLSKTTTTNEDGFRTIEFKDKQGQVLCRRTEQTAGVLLSIDYIYNDLGQLCYVVPPLPVANGSNAAVALPTAFTEADNVFLNFFYGYHYDDLGRLTEKKVPGQGWQYLVYNNRDQLILSQDANQKLNNTWMATKYDGQGRVVLTGKYYSTSARATLQAAADASTTDLFESFINAATFYGYTHNSWPDISTGTNNKVLSVHYFDNYDILANTSVNPNGSIYAAPATAIDTLEQFPRNLPVATLTNVLGTASYLFSVIHYDKDGRVVKVSSQHYQGATVAYNKYDTQENAYSFQGLVVQNTRKHYQPLSGSPQLTINNWNTYDHSNRPVLVKQQFISSTNTGGVVTLGKNDYNEIGQLKTRHQHSTNTAALPPDNSFLQHIDYRYNARGWLTRINDPTQTTDQTFTGVLDVFSEQLSYEAADNGYAIAPKYSGNITSVKWQTLVPSSMSPAVTQEQHGYQFSYDGLSRLTGATSQSSASGSGLFDETAAYDVLGNITGLTRKKNGTILNSMLYNYMDGSNRGNRLISLADNGTVAETQATTYSYNTNGSVTGDTKKGLTAMVYNELNLPATITAGSKTIGYTYDASGTKLERKVVTGSTTADDRFYDNGIEYNGSSIAFVQTTEGRAVSSLGAYIYEYMAKDHLGNTRAVYGDKNNNGILAQDEILQVSDYYPFGREIQYAANLVPNPDNQYKYNGKEYQGDLGEYDYGARFYDAVIGRWNCSDPLAEKSRRFSPYVYANNNPVRFIDPDGMEAAEDDDDQWRANAIRRSQEIGNAIATSSKPGDIGDPEPSMVSNSNKQGNNKKRSGDGSTTDQTNVANANQGREFAPNSAYVIRDGNVEAKRQIGQLLIEYLSGTGPERSLFFGNSNIVQKYLRHSIYEAMAVNAFFDGGQKPIDHMKVDWNLWEATAEYVIGKDNNMANFLGSARMSVTPVGNMLRLQLDNTTDQHSLYLHLPWIHGEPRSPGQLTPQGTIYQRFIWYVEIK